MARGRELSPQMRSRICELRSIGYSYKHIHEIHREIPISTIKYTVKKEAIRNNNQSLSRTGTPRKLSEEDRDHLFDLAINQDPHTKIRELRNEVENRVHKDTVGMLLPMAGLCIGTRGMLSW
jgi:hypothetical protein